MTTKFEISRRLANTPREYAILRILVDGVLADGGVHTGKTEYIRKVANSRSQYYKNVKITEKTET